MTVEEFYKKLKDSSYQFSKEDFEKARRKFIDDYEKNFFPTPEEQKKENERVNKIILD
jgi:hypothetical protein